jgi:hypothetical protein
MKAIGNPVEVDFYVIQSWDPQDAEGNWVAHCSEGKDFVITSSMVAREPRTAYHYVVVQADGYTYLNPKEVFERKYSPIGIGQAGKVAS